MPLDTEKKTEEWGLIYRIVTGACQLGVKMFMEEKKIKKSYTLQEILEETKGAYRGEEFRKIVLTK